MQLEERRGEDKPHLRAGRGLVSTAALQLGYGIGQLQGCDLSRIMHLGFTALSLSAQVYDVQCKWEPAELQETMFGCAACSVFTGKRIKSNSVKNTTTEKLLFLAMCQA